MVDFIESYDEKTVPELRDSLDQYTASQLDEIVEYEKNHKNRVTLLDAIDSAYPDDGDRTDSRREAEDTAGGDSGSDSGTRRQDDGSEETTEEDGPIGKRTEGERVVIAAPGRGYYDGFWFDSAGRMTVTYSKRVADAVANTDLRLVDD